MIPRSRRVCIILLVLGSVVAPLVAHPGSGIVVDQRGTVYFIDTGGGIWRIEPGGALAKHGGPNFHWLALDQRGLFAGGRLPSIPSAEITAVGTNPTLLASSDVPIAVGPDGALYYPEFGADQRLRIIRFTAAGAKSVHAVLPSPPESTLRWINGLAADTHGSLFFTEDKAVKKIDPQGVITTIASDVTVPDCTSVPGVEANAQPYLRGLAVAADGSLFVAASGCGAVIKITPRGHIETVLRAVSPWSPTAVAISPNGVFVLEYLHTVEENRPAWLPRVRKLSPNGTVTTMADVTQR